MSTSGSVPTRHEFDRIERAPVTGDATVGTSASIHVLKGEARHVAAGMAAQISDGWKATMQLDEARVVGGRVIVRRGPDQSSRVVHEVPLGFSLAIIATGRGARPLSQPPTAPLPRPKGRSRSLPALDAQKWLNEGCRNTSGRPSEARKRAAPCPAVTAPISVTATPAAEACRRNGSTLPAGTHATTS